MIKIAPSLLAADFMRIGEEISDIERAGADMLHMDVMDGIYVPQITFGEGMLGFISRGFSLPVDVHLMVDDPDMTAGKFLEGAYMVTVHAERARHADRLLNSIRQAGVRAGIALNPGTPPSVLEYLLDVADHVLIMSVNPGYGGQKFIPSSLDKITAVKNMIVRRGLPTLIEVDGGVSPDNARALADAGADILVAGSAVFGAADRAAAIKALRQ